MLYMHIKEKWNSLALPAKVSLAYMVCNIIQNSFSFITVPLFTRLLTITQYGQYTIYQSWQAVLSLFLTLNLAYGTFQTAMAKFEEDKEGYIASVEGICIVLSAFFLSVYFPFQQHWNRIFELPAGIILLMVAEVLGTTSIQMWSRKEKFDYRYKGVVLITLLISVLSPAFAFLFVQNSVEKGYARIVGYASVSITFGLFFFLINVLKGKKVFNKRYLQYAIGFNVPLIIYYLAQIVYIQSDRIMISHIVGMDKAAIYGVAYSLAMVLSFVRIAINDAYVPWFYRKIKSGELEDNIPVSNGLSIIMAVLLFCVIWFAPEIVRIMAGTKYMDAVYCVPPIALCLLIEFYCDFFIDLEFYFEEKKKMNLAYVAAAIVNIVLNFLLIKPFGFIVAAYTTLASYIVLALTNYLVMKKTLYEQNIESKLFNYHSLISIFVVLAGIAILALFLYQFVITRIVGFCIVAYIAFVRREMVLQYISLLRQG